jgi:hypothetical protein
VSEQSDSLRILVLGYLVRGPLGGMAWHHLQYALGLADLGHDVHFLEDSGDSQYCCYDPTRHVTDTDPSYGLRFAARAFGRLGLGDRWAYFDAHSARWLGPSAERVRALCGQADLVLNLSGSNPLRPWFAEIPIRVFVDTDPVFTQIRNITDPGRRELALGHTAFFTFGENLAAGCAGAPSDGLPWQPTRQPVVLRVWPVTAGPRDGRFTSVLQWESYPAREHDGRRYGMKSDSFSAYIGLPQRAGRAFELAIGSSGAPRDELRRRGWRVIDPAGASRDPWAYQRFIQRSKGEFGIAKHGYVTSRSGWFSERSAAYLASGRPVLVQETGFSDWLEAPAGVVPFTSVDEAVSGLRKISKRYDAHCRAARKVAEEYFDARTVLSALVDRAVTVRAVATPVALA